MEARTVHSNAAGPFLSLPPGPRAVGCFSVLVTPYVSILDALVARALKNSQLSCGETYAYFGEGPHELARIIFHGKRNELRQRYREGQEDQLGALGLVVNAVVLWNTIYMDAALAELRAEGFDVRDEDVARLSPLGHGHLNVFGSLCLHASRVRRTRRTASVAPSWRVV